MKRCIKNPFLFALLVFGLMLTGRVTAQTFTVLHTFTALPAPNNRNSDGAFPIAPLSLWNNTLYGTASSGGAAGAGTVFGVHADGTVFTNLYVFVGQGGGGVPSGGLNLVDTMLYGTSRGFIDGGTVFGVNTDGTGITNIYGFTGGFEGRAPMCDLVLSGKTFYGTTAFAGNSGYGTVFAVNSDGTGFRILHSFDGVSGSRPQAGLVLLSNTLYGTTTYGGLGYGTIFAVDTNGANFVTLHSFAGASDDGANPRAGLTLSGDSLYGTTFSGGISSAGTLFRININGTGFTNFDFFSGIATNSLGIPTNSEGAGPIGGLSLSSNTLYGTTSGAGDSGSGTVFGVNIPGTGYATLYSFSLARTNSSGAYTNNDGAFSVAGVILSGNTLYGVARTGGTSGSGTVFSLFILPQLTITASGTNVILNWPTNYVGFTLQSTTNLVSQAIWTTNLPSPVVVNGQNTVANPISGTQRFFRLSQ